jgi:integrase
MPRRSIPRYCLHKASGQAYVKIDGRRIYLGVHGTSASHSRYTAEISKWQARQTEVPADLKVRQLTVLYLKHAESYYVKDGKPTSKVQSIRDALKRLNKLHRDALAAEFSPKMLKAVQRSLIAAGLCRTTINATIARIRRMFRWAVSEELVPTTILVGLETVRDLRRGRSEAREPEQVNPVPTEDINAVLPHVSRQVKDMIRLQLLSGCRPADTCRPEPGARRVERRCPR